MSWNMIERENFDMKYDLLLKGGQVFTEGRLQEADIYVKRWSDCTDWKGS